MIVAVSITSIGLFIYSLYAFGLLQAGKLVLNDVQYAFTIIRDDRIDDDRREKEIQKASIKLFGVFISILIRTVLTLVISIVPVYIANKTGLINYNDIIEFVSRWDVIAVTSILMIGGFVFGGSRHDSADTAISDYSAIDRLLHNLAFRSPSIQLTGADIEKALLAKTYEGVEPDAPVFITSLPRAGTTLTLEALYKIPSLCTHTYRDMPFLMCPMLWSRFSRLFVKQSVKRERAHGDGVEIGYDSPEAFEEIIWRAFWPEKYSSVKTSLWNSRELKDDARMFFNDHMKKIIKLRQTGERNVNGRYISKNNGNMARLDLIAGMFPGARILMPIRRPMEQAASLLRQHENFLKKHNEDPFIRQYMADLGHYEFGELHRPIDFPGVDDLLAGRDPETIDYWLAYWIAAFEHVLSLKTDILIVSYEAVCADARRELAGICKQLDISVNEGTLDEIASMFREPSPGWGDGLVVDPELKKRAEAVYNALLSRGM